MSSKNNSGIQISEEDLHAMGEVISKAMGEAAITVVKFSACVGEMIAEAGKIMIKITKTLHEVYLANGAPYGDSQAGFFLWLKEEQEHARKEGENG